MQFPSRSGASVVALAEHDRLHIGGGYIFEQLAPNGGVDFFFEIAFDVNRLYSVASDYLREITLAEVSNRHLRAETMPFQFLLLQKRLAHSDGGVVFIAHLAGQLQADFWIPPEHNLLGPSVKPVSVNP